MRGKGQIMKEKKLRHRIIFECLEKIGPKYPILFWEVSGSTARGDFSPEADIDLAIELEVLAEAKTGEEKIRIWYEFEEWIKPILQEFKNKYGIEIDLSW